MTTTTNNKPEPIYAEPTKTKPPTGDQFRPSNDYQPLTIFQQNRELWQKRSSTVSVDGEVVIQQATQPQVPTLSYNPKSQSAILTRNRLQPDLVMDLPPPSQQDNVTPPLSSGSTSASSSMTSLDKQTIDEPTGNDDEADETLGDHFAKQNQSTLKKNEKFGSAVVEKKSEKLSEPVKAHSSKIDDVVLRIEESNEGSDANRLSATSTSSLKIEKSPIPVHNTQRFVSQFADLKLTGGCSTIAKTTTTPTQPLVTQAEKNEKDRASFTFGMKPAISVKPQVLTKKKSIFLQAHQSPSNDRHSSSSTESNSQQ